MATRKAAQPKLQQYSWEEIEGAVGASDGESGGGNGAWSPDGELGMREGERVARGSVARDKKKLFPERRALEPATAKKGTGKTTVSGRKKGQSATQRRRQG
jgi:hypothetical protein